MSGTIVRRCTCKHKDQDKLYGKRRRVFNIGGTQGGTATFTCTVCGRKI